MHDFSLLIPAACGDFAVKCPWPLCFYLFGWTGWLGAWPHYV